MKCPKCGSPFFRVTHTYVAGPGTISKRRRCLRCKVVGVTAEVLLDVAPAQGSGAKAVAEAMKKAPEGALGDRLREGLSSS